jgi:hypothetical protein
MIFFLEVQEMTPITKHICILIRMQITPKLSKFILWPNTNQFAQIRFIKKLGTKFSHNTFDHGV